ncbi:hypothetical protein FKM82_019132 [Ascaphus truei]
MINGTSSPGRDQFKGFAIQCALIIGIDVIIGIVWVCSDMERAPSLTLASADGTWSCRARKVPPPAHTGLIVGRGQRGAVLQ